jgi:hydrophobe/amphiphile efflux-1 (HAE1) family protein
MRSLPELSIRRPVFAWMLMLGLIIFGALSYTRLGLSQLPDVDFPVLSVNVTWEGAAPEVLETEIADPLEQALVSVEGLRELSSTLRQGSASISLEFDLERDVDAALQEAQAAISRVRLPLDVDPPTIRKSNPEDQPILWLGISGNLPLREMIRLVEQQLKDQFQVLPGVGEVVLGGYTERNLRIWVDNSALQKHELTILDVRDALERQHLETAAGRIEDARREVNLRVMGEGLTPEDVGNIVISQRGGRPVYQTNLQIKDVARVEDGLADVRRFSRVNGAPGLGIGIRKQRGANAVAIAQAVRERMREVEQMLPPGITIGVNFDSTIFIKESVEETQFTVLLSALATSLVCFLFLGSWRPTFNILLSIPTSIIGTLSVLYFMGFTLNFFTILALALAIGIVVDDAIMVLENIYRHKAMGKSARQASLEGAEEISFAAIAATISVVAIFLPVAFMQGVIGKFFFQFGVTISAAVLLSLLEAVTLTPMRCAALLGEQDAGVLERMLDRLFSKVAQAYRWLLSLALRCSWLVVILSMGIFWYSLQQAKSLRKEFIPPQDQSVFIARIQTPVGSSMQFTSEKMKHVETFLQSRPEVVRIFGSVGGFGGGEVNSGMLFVTLKNPAERSLSQAEFMTLLRREMSKVPELKVSAQDLSTRGFTAQRGFPVEFNIRGPSWEVLAEKSKAIIEKLEASGLMLDVDSDYRLGQPELRIRPLRAEAARRGVSVESIVNTVAAAYGSIRQGKFTQGGRRYDVRLSLEQQARSTPELLEQLAVRNQFGELVPLAQLVQTEEVSSLQTITRRNRERSVSIFANIVPGASQADALALAQRVSLQELPPGYHFHLSGGAQTFTQAFESLYFVLLLGLVVAYMVLASQFNSFIHPLTVLLALPFSLSGAVWALSLSDQSLNLYSMIGIVLLMGIVKKNSILLVEFANQLRQQGVLCVREALLTAAPIRLRPILMTSAATLAAALPPALAIGPGAESRVPMALAIVGGVLVSTVFTLFVVPCAYQILSRVERRQPE